MSPKLSRNTRLKVITKHLTTCKYEEIAQLCGVTERTIQRDIKRWKKNGGFSQFLMKEFFEMYGVLKRIDNKYAFGRVCDLLRLNKTLFGIDEETQGVDEIKLTWEAEREREIDKEAHKLWWGGLTQEEKDMFHSITIKQIRIRNELEKKAGIRSTIH